LEEKREAKIIGGVKEPRVQKGGCASGKLLRGKTHERGQGGRGIENDSMRRAEGKISAYWRYLGSISEKKIGGGSRLKANSGGSCKREERDGPTDSSRSEGVSCVSNF